MKNRFIFLLIFAMLLALTGCGGEGSSPETEAKPQMDPSGKYVLDARRNEAVIDDAGVVTASNEGNARVYYQIFVGSFSDSNGDGIGDLRGIIDRFDYLNDGDPNSGVSLGVEGIWLSPVFTSPSYHKYDVTDYYAIDAQFGTMEDLKELIKVCHERDVQIILDLVINHSSASNQWFKDFCTAHRQGNTDSEYYDFYSWTDSPEAGKTYQKIPGTQQYYECNFSSVMPELNFDNESVRQKMVEVAKYYLDMGVDGFRFDAAKYIYYGEEPRNIAFWEWYMAELRAIKPDIYTVAEVWDADGVTIPYFSSTNCFNFTLSQVDGRIAQAAKAGDVNVLTAYVEDYLSQIRARREDAMMVSFIANHDMDRAAGFLTLASGQAKVAANISILMPGSSFIYYGEEIGLKGSRGGANTDANRRLAMLWGDGDTVSDPVGADYGSSQSNGTVADHLPNGDSLYSHYKKLITIRKANPEIAYGEYKALNITGSKLGGFTSTCNGSAVTVLHNTSLSAVTVDLGDITDIAAERIAASVGAGGATLEDSVLTIDGQTSVILK